VSIRLAKPNDALSIAEVHVAAWRTAYKGIMPDDFLASLDVQQKAQAWECALQEPSPGITLVWEYNQEVVGFCVYGPSRDSDAPRDTTGELVAINFHPLHWRRGFGTKMCRYVIHEGKKKNWHTLTLWVLKQNTPARCLYEKLGFLPDGTEKVETKIIGAPLHEVRYMTSLERVAG
jgi:RimJ/RimL family protein N-acetyltransferase